jgi:single stranded DNA-binding protein
MAAEPEASERARDRERSPDPRVVELARLEVAGYLGRDAQVIQTASREFVALSVAATRSWRDADGQVQERTLWVKVLAFGESAGAVRDLKKGAPVYAVGPLSYDRWQSTSGPRHAPVIRVSERQGEVQSAPMPGGQYARVTLAGWLARDASVQRRPEAESPVFARLAVQARASHAVVVQGPLVEHVAERLKQGHGLRLEGRLELRRWQDAAGQPRERVTVVVGGPESQIRVDRAPLPGFPPDPRPEAMPDLDPPAGLEHAREERERR